MNFDYFQKWWRRVAKLSEDEKVTLASAMFGSLEAYGFKEENFERLLRQAKSAKIRAEMKGE